MSNRLARFFFYSYYSSLLTESRESSRGGLQSLITCSTTISFAERGGDSSSLLYHRSFWLCNNSSPSLLVILCLAWSVPHNGAVGRWLHQLFNLSLILRCLWSWFFSSSLSTFAHDIGLILWWLSSPIHVPMPLRTSTITFQSLDISFWSLVDTNINTHQFKFYTLTYPYLFHGGSLLLWSDVNVDISVWSLVDSLSLSISSVYSSLAHLFLSDLIGRSSLSSLSR